MNLGTNVKKLGKTTVSGFKNVGSGMKSMFKFKSEENNNNYKSSEVKKFNFRQDCCEHVVS